MKDNVKVEVLIDNFKDNEIYNKETEIERNGKKIKVLQKLLQVGDKYETSNSRAKYLSKLGYVKLVDKKDKKTEEDNN